MWEHGTCKGNIGTFCNYQIRYRLLDLLRKKFREQEDMEHVMREKKRVLDQGNRHQATQMPLPNVDGFVLENEAKIR